MPVQPLPSDLVDCILDHLISDRATLLNCALVTRPCARASQRGIFNWITLYGPDPAEYLALFDVYLKANSRLIEAIEANPRLGTYVRSLDLTLTSPSPNTTIDQLEALYTSTAGVIQRLPNVDTLTFLQLDWDMISPLLRDALSHTLMAPSLTRVHFNVFCIRQFSQWTSLVSQMTRLKVFEVDSLVCNNWDMPNVPVAGSSYPGTSSRSIQLNDLSLYRTSVVVTFWFLMDSCPFEIRNLRTLVFTVSGHFQTISIHAPTCRWQP